MAEE
jgi:hypothetical protein